MSETFRIGWTTPGVCSKQDSCPECVSETPALSSFKIPTVNNYADSVLLLSDFLNSNLCKWIGKTRVPTCSVLCFRSLEHNCNDCGVFDVDWITALTDRSIGYKVTVQAVFCSAKLGWKGIWFSAKLRMAIRNPGSGLRRNVSNIWWPQNDLRVLHSHRLIIGILFCRQITLNSKCAPFYRQFSSLLLRSFGKLYKTFFVVLFPAILLTTYDADRRLELSWMI